MPRETCSDCGGALVRGFLLDQGHSARYVQRWIEGEPSGGFWTGLKLKGRDCRSVESWRCSSCGLLKSYARAPAKLPGWPFQL